MTSEKVMKRKIVAILNFRKMTEIWGIRNGKALPSLSALLQRLLG